MTEAFQSKSLTIVAAGTFAPAMFHPSWFQRHELIGEQEATVSAESQSLLVSPDMTILKVAGIDLQIRQDRFQAGTTLENLFEVTRDLFCSTLEILEALSVTAVGINWAAHYSMPSQKAWHTAGDRLVPKTFWSNFWTKHVGMKNLAIELERNDDFGGKINVTIEPSNAVQNGVYIAINDHYDLKSETKPGTAAESASLIGSQWNNSREIASKIFMEIYKETTRE